MRNAYSHFVLLLSTASSATHFVAASDDEHAGVSRLRSKTEVGSRALWPGYARSNHFDSIKDMTSLKGKVMSFEEEGDEVDGFFKSLVGGQSSMPVAPSSTPTESVVPSSSPSNFGSGVPTPDSESPSESAQPSFMPSMFPSDFPTDVPTSVPSHSPSDFPTGVPTSTPTKQPTFRPTQLPSSSPSEEPSGLGSSNPTTSMEPSVVPTLPVCQLSPGQRVIGILAILDQVADSALIRDPTTPQGQATAWILNDDDLACPTDPKLIQRWALAVMYFSTEGDDWDLCSNNPTSPCDLPPFVGDSAFLSEINECEWAGIRCNEIGCVTAIEFENNGLAGTLPTELALLTDLAFLGLEQGETTGTIPSELGSLSNLFFIDFDFNQLTGSIPPEIYGLSLLRTLDLNNNQLTGSIDPAIGNLLNLNFFQIQNNLFFGTVPSEIGNLDRLTTFTLHNNFLLGVMPDEICALRPAPLRFLIADCGGPNPDIVCDLSCCSQCRAT